MMMMILFLNSVAVSITHLVIFSNTSCLMDALVLSLLFMKCKLLQGV